MPVLKAAIFMLVTENIAVFMASNNIIFRANDIGASFGKFPESDSTNKISPRDIMANKM